jgi:DNA polymerase elongation subunit (family B)
MPRFFSKFQNLTEEDKVAFTRICVSSGKDAGYKFIQNKYKVTDRTVRNWMAKGILSPVDRPTHQAKILVLDIETAPIESYVWGTWNQNIGHNLSQIKHDWFVISFSAKALFEENMFSDVLTPKEILAKDDKRLLKKIWNLLNSFDIIILHNGIKFDIKRINGRFLYHGLMPPSPYQIIDTYVHSKRQFHLTSYRLNFIGEYLGLGGKLENGGFDLWKRCLDGDPEALQLMMRYCDRDVELLEEVYLRLRPYIKPHPNLGLFITEDINSCPACASTDLTYVGDYTTYANQYSSHRCNGCGALSRSRKSNTSLRSKSKLNISIP